eukprot:SAG31_NODE_17722_length_660_cov_0.784314_1_plen_60_part_10
MPCVVVLTILDNVKSSLVYWQYSGKQWVPGVGPTAGGSIATISARAVDPEHSDDFWISSA